MSNSDWASEAFGPLHRDPREQLTEDFAAIELTEEIELTDGCPACFDWVWGRTVEPCKVHRTELDELRLSATDLWSEHRGDGYSS